ncbi:MAG: hypothetical protein GWN29_03855, partial [Gammaproteobacteria bacterium]|nr:hypothetical protein [Gammaproteobacteria bacterium]
MLALFVAVLGLLAAIRVLFSIPKPLLIVSAIVFALCAAVFWISRSRITGVALTQMFGLVMAWITVSALLFGTAFWVDRAGWIWFQLTGYNVTLSEDYTEHVDSSLAEFVRRNPMFTVTNEVGHDLTLRGEHVVDRTILIPRGTSLVIEPGTVLRFGRGCSMISYGTITARGTEDEPILFTARHPFLKWGVVGVVGNERASGSVFEHAQFDQGRQARVNAIDFPGCLSVIGAAVEIRNCRFSGLYGKDAVYVRSGNVLIRDNLFADTFKDG